MPLPHGGCAAASAGGLVVLVGGEAPSGTQPEVHAYDPARRSWRNLPRSPEPRHGVGIAAVGTSVYQLLGGPEPGLFVSRTARALRVR